MASLNCQVKRGMPRGEHLPERGSSYDLIAAEYYEARHVTSRNFDAATAAFFRSRTCPFPSDGMVLEIGAGRGSVGGLCGLAHDRVIQTDVCLAMLMLRPREKSRWRLQCDARSLPFVDRGFAGVAALLFDPYNGFRAFAEISRVLRTDGVFLGTLPHHEWGTQLRAMRRQDASIAAFRTKSGETVELPSVLSTDEELIGALRAVSLEPCCLADLYLPPDVTAVSPDIADPAQELGISAYNLPIVKLVIARKD
jgi:SAM-dependent methyltransferase